MKRFLLPLLLVIVGPALAADDCACVARGTYLLAFSSPFDQHQALTSNALLHGAEHVQTAVATQGGPSQRYLVLVRACESFYCSSTRRRESMMAQAIASPEDFPWEWAEFTSLPDAVFEFNAHGGATARGLVTMGDGTLVVYWSRVIARTDQD